MNFATILAMTAALAIRLRYGPSIGAVPMGATPVADAIAVKLTARQRSNARTIEAVMRSEGFTNSDVIQAAIANAMRESNLSHTAVGDHGCSIGLFQCNTCGGAGQGLDKDKLKSPVFNTQTILRVLKSAAGKRTLAAHNAADAAEFWTRDIERPAKPDLHSQISRNWIAKFWP